MVKVEGKGSCGLESHDLLKQEPIELLPRDCLFLVVEITEARVEGLGSRLVLWVVVCLEVAVREAVFDIGSLAWVD